MPDLSLDLENQGPPLIENHEMFCNRYGSIRLTLVRKHYGLKTVDIGSHVGSNGILEFFREKVMVQELSDQDLSDITDLYVNWRDTREVMPMRITYLEQEIIDCSELPVNPQALCDISKNGVLYNNFLFRDVEREEWIFRETVKRGNRPYIENIKNKFKIFTEKEPIMFFNENWGIKKTPMLYISGTIEHEKISRCEAWLHFGDYWNIFITNLRNQYGKIAYIRTWQSQKNGYPHFHALVYFRDYEFTVVDWLSEEGKQSWRLPSRSEDRKNLKSAWKWGYLDIVCVQNTHDAFQDLLKYVTRDLEGGESDLTNAMVWFFGKQSFSYSKDLVQLIWGNGKTPASLEPSDADLINTVSSNSNFCLIKIEVFPICRADFLHFNWEKEEPPPPQDIRMIEEMGEEQGIIRIDYGSSRIKINGKENILVCDECHEEKRCRNILGLHVCYECYSYRGWD